jgi:hypothetical protein
MQDEEKQTSLYLPFHLVLAFIPSMMKTPTTNKEKD